MRRLRRPLVSILAAALLAAPVRATWSIVAVDTISGEIVVASATCIANFDLERWLPVLLPEVGAGCAQSIVDSSGANRTRIRNDLLLGMSPDEILLDLAAHDPSHQGRQYGIVDTQGRAATFTGANAGQWAGGVTGRTGTIVYAIQGNVLTCADVVLQAEQALRNTSGDLTQKVMAAMEAARAFGGDGRCSCGIGNPTGCGCPPPNFVYPAYTGFLMASRPGDVDGGPCTYQLGCAYGDYYLDINVISYNGGPEPVAEIRRQYDLWRAAQAGRPDAFRSEVTQSHEEIPAGSSDLVSVLLRLFDIDGLPLTAGGATVTIEHDARSAGLSTLRNVVDHGNGTYTVELQPGPSPGVDLIRVIVDDGVRAVTLWPPVRLILRPADPVPFNDAAPIAGLNGSGADAQPFLLPDGLTAWFLSDRGPGGVRVLRATRPTPGDPFGPAAEVPGLAVPGLLYTDFWVSADELRFICSALAPGGAVEQILRSTRAATTDPFPAPELVAELDSGAGDGGPWLSQDERTLYFHSAQGGSRDLWRADRLSQDAFWFAPSRIEELASPDDEMHPLLSENGTRLVFSRRDAAGALDLAYADLRPAGFAGGGPLPGAVHQSGREETASSLPAGELWITSAPPGGADALRALATPSALSAAPGRVSAAAGGRVDFQLDAGAAWAGAAYALVAGGSGPAPGAALLDAVLPLAADEVTSFTLARQPAAVFQGFRGVLDGSGRASAALVVPAGAPVPSAYLDRDYLFAFAALRGGRAFAGNSVTVRLEP